MNYGLQLYSVRDAAEENYSEMLRQIAEMGYTAVETAGFFGIDAKEISAMMKQYGLTVCSTHTGIPDLLENLEETVAYHRAIGCTDLIIPGAKFGTKEETAVLVEQLNRFGPLLAAEGIRLHYHNHSKEFLPNQDGQIVHDVLAEQTDVLFEIDTFWAFNAGVSPLELMAKYRDRIKFIHLKDGLVQNFADPKSKAKGKSLGDGQAPVAEVRSKALEMNLNIVVESEGLDPTGLEEVRRCINYLKKLDQT